MLDDLAVFMGDVLLKRSSATTQPPVPLTTLGARNEMARAIVTRYGMSKNLGRSGLPDNPNHEMYFWDVIAAILRTTQKGQHSV